MKNIFKLILTFLSILFFSFNLKSVSASTKTITVGIVGTSEQDLWKSISKTSEKKYNIHIKTKVFKNYNTPNQELLNGSLDLNAFQNTAFLNNWNKSNNNQLKAIGKTYLAPINIYAKNIHKIKDIKTNSTIAIPNDPTNKSRALNLLQTAGLIKLKKNNLSSIKDIKENKLQIKFKEISADKIPNLLNSVDAAVINTNYAQESNLTIKKSIYVEPINKTSQKWINVIVINKKQSKNKDYQNVVKAYQTQKTKKYFTENWGDTQIPAWDIKLKQMQQN